MRRPWEFLRTARSWFVLFGLVVLLPSLCLGWFSLRALRGEQLRQRYAEGERRQQLVRFLDSDLNNWLFALQGAAQIPGGFRFQIDRAELVAPALNVFVGDSPQRPANPRWEQLRQTEGSAPAVARSTYHQLVETRSPSAPLARLALFRLASEEGDSKAAQKWLAAIRQNDRMALTESGIPLWIASALLVTPQNSDCGFLRETLDHLVDGRWRLSATRWVVYAGELTTALRLCPAPVRQFPDLSALLERIEQRRQHLQLLVDLHPQMQPLPVSGPVEKRYFPAQAAFVILYPGAAPTTGMVMPAETIRQQAGDRLAQLGFGEDLASFTTVQLSTAGASAATQHIPIPSFPDLKVSFRETGGGLFGFQQHFFLYSTLLLFLTTLFGLIFAYRAVSREMEVSRLKADFVAGVSHEFRSPLTSILALMERLEAGKISDQENLQRYHQVIGQEVRRLSRLVNDVLDFARLEEGKKEFSREPSDLTELARQAVASFHNLGHADQVQWVEPKPGPRPIVFADRSAVGRCIQNLVDNAIKYSPAGSPVSVQTGGDNGEVFVEVSDRGPGIPSAEQRKIFEHFYRIGETNLDCVKGTGLGLALVKRIMEGHGGRVTLDSAPGAGSRFRLVFPAKSEHS